MELGFTPQEVSDVRIVFDVFDVPGKGWIPLDDLRKALRLLGFKISRERVQQVAAEVQGKALMRGQTDFPAFLHTVSKLQGSSYDKYGEIMQAFSLLDADGDGGLSAEDLCLAGVSGPDAQAMITEANKTGTGLVTLEEFVNVMMRTNLFKKN